MPTFQNSPSGQIVELCDKSFLVDCGEGTQVQIYKYGMKLTNLDAIFISHMHGDHFFGLLPLLSSMGLMLGRTADLDVFIPAEMEEHLQQEKQIQQHIQ